MKKNAFGTTAPRTTMLDAGQRKEGPECNRSIGRYIREICNLSDEDVARISAFHREHGTRFGDAAIALHLASKEEVVWALSQQFRYSYAYGEASVLAPELVIATDPFGDQADAFRELRSQLLLGVLARDQPCNALAVLSADEGDGKSYFAANIAAALSQVGGRTVLVDANMRTPRLHSIFGIPGSDGLSNILVGRAELNVAHIGKHNVITVSDKRVLTDQETPNVTDVRAVGELAVARPGIGMVHQITELPGLYLLPVGTLPPNPLELVQHVEFAALLQKLTTTFDHVIVDTPAAARAADARVIASECGSAVVVGRRHRSAIKAMKKLIDAVTKTPTRIAGMLINEY